MRVFILCTGRSGSSTFIKACKYITNYSCGHETRVKKIGEQRFAYPDNHIEADNRLAWFLGGLQENFGDDAFYVHLTRDRDETIDSFMRRWKNTGSIIKAFTEGVLLTTTLFMSKKDKEKICGFYYDTVNANIESFLENKPHKLTIKLNKIGKGFDAFWSAIHAEGDLEKAHRELRTRHNKS